MNLIVAVHQSPEVVLVVRAVQAQPEARPQGAHHRGDAGRGQVPGVKRLQLHANLELILGRDLVLLEALGRGGQRIGFQQVVFPLELGRRLYLCQRRRTQSAPRGHLCQGLLHGGNSIA